MIGIILTLQWGHDYQRTSTVFSADHSDHSDHSYDSLRSGPVHTWICLGWIWMLKILLLQANYLTIVKWCLALHSWTVWVLLVTQLNGREKLWTELNCAQSVSSSWPSREAEFPSLSRSPPPPDLDNWQLTSSTTLRRRHVWKCSTLHFLFLEGISIWLSTSSKNRFWQVSK